MTSSTLPSSEYRLRSTIAIRLASLWWRGRQRGLPDLALVQLAVAEQHEDVGSRGRYPRAEAMPRPTDSAWPSEPELKSTPGTCVMSG